MVAALKYRMNGSHSVPTNYNQGKLLFLDPPNDS